MTCRGSRFADGAKRNPDGEVFMKNRETDEWMKQNIRSTRNFIRKWGHFVKHDSLLKPIIPPKYNIGLVVKNLNNYELLYELEPWCSNIYGEYPKHMRVQFIHGEQPDTMFDLNDRVRGFYDEKNNDILVKFDASRFTQQHMNYITNLSEILSNDENIEIGEFELDIFTITIVNLKTYEKDLIKCER